MDERFIQLKPSINIMGGEGTFDKTPTLTPTDWKVLQDMMDLLEPFKRVQKFLEAIIRSRLAGCCRC